jgi:PAS domain S-box-containing protein
VGGTETENTVELSVQQQDDVLSELESSTSDLDRIMSALPNGFATFDREWRYTYANNRLLEIFKLSLAEVLGKKAWEIFPHQVGIENFDLLNRAMTERIEAQFEFYYEIADCWVEHRVYPTADGLAILMADITERKQAEKISQRAAKFDSFRLTLADALRSIANPVTIQAAASRILGEHLDANRIAYFEVRDDNYFIEHDYVNGAEPLVGSYPIDSFGAQLLAAFRSGRTVSESDLAADLSLSPAERAAYTAIQIGAYIAIPLIKDGKFVAGLAVHSAAPRDWTPDEVAIAEEVAERTWAALERARAEAALRESEAKYRTLFESMDEGYVLMDLIFDAEDRPVDLYYLEANPAAVGMMGTNPVGLQASEIFAIESHWMETLDRVAKTGIGERHELHYAQLDTWYSFYVFKIGGADSRRVAFIYEDVTERKRREANLAFLTEIQDEFTRLVSADEIMQTVGAKIGAYLNVTHCTFVEIDDAQDTAVCEYGWHTSDTPSSVGVYQLSEFVSAEFQQAARARETIVINDTQTDTRVDADSYAALNIHASVSVPFHDGNEWKYLLNVLDSRSRDWREDEIELVSELVNRIFPRLERARAEATVAANLRDTQLLRELGARLVSEDDTQTLYREILTTAIDLTGADAGTVQILDDRSQDLLLIDSHGFDRQMTEYFDRINANSHTPCGIALRNGERMFVDFDVPEGEDPDGSMRLHFEAGYQSAQSTPLISRTGKPLGMVSTHWRSPHRPNDSPKERLCQRELHSLDLLARQAADLIEQQQTTAALRESEAQLRLASDAAKVGMWFWNLETDSLIWTEQCKALFGLPAETEMSYAVFKATLHPDDRERTQAAVDRAIADRTDYDIEYRSCRSDGSVHWLAAKGSCTYDPTGKPVRMMGVVIDINALKQAQIELQQSLAILNTINQATPTLIFVKDRQGRVQMGNPALMGVLGKPESEVLGYTDAEFYPNPDDATVVMATDRQVMETGQTQVVEETLDLPEGRRTFLSTKSPYTDETGTIVGLVGVSFDISLRKQMEAALADRNQELDSFVYVVSHDLKAPLRAISNLSQWIEEDLGTDLPAEIGQQMTQLRDRVRRMEAMINGLLGYARVGRTDVAIELVSVTELLAEILDSLMPPSTFEVTIAPNMPTFPTKRLLLSQVFSNLIGNAFKHHDKFNGFIRISCQEQGDFYKFTIVDDGPGIPPEQHDRVFVIFQSSNPQKKSDSTGIGLSIVKKIVETAGGSIWLESEPGKGTTFYFTWPK